MKTRVLFVASCSLALVAFGAGELEKAFENPPHAAKPHTWYHIMNGNLTKAGITRDFEELAKIGVGGVQMFDAGCNIPPGGLNFNSPEWFDLLLHAAREARRLGLEICIPNCSGWSSSGGPWNPPANAMKEVVWSETRAKGPSHLRRKLTRDQNDHGYYQDIAVLAFPTPPAELVDFKGVKTEIGKNAFSFSAADAFEMAGVSFRLKYANVWGAASMAELSVSEDGANFKSVESFHVPLACSGSTDQSLRYQSFKKPIRTKFARIEFRDSDVQFTIEEAHPEAKMGISNLRGKTFQIRNEPKRDTCTAAPNQIVKKDGIIDISESLQADGVLDWQVPEGNWTIVRIGNKCNGRRNHPASDHGVGLEVDKLSAAAMDFHFEQYVGRLVRHLGENAGNGELGLNNILVDSYEVGSQNWTQGLDGIFERRRGYSMRRYLPAFTGRIVGSVDETERFLEDFRRVVADLFAENYAQALTRKCHQYGLKCSIEPYGNCPSDNLQYGSGVDIPMGEFWSGAGAGNFGVDEGNARFAAYIAHVWGKKIAATESFTASPSGGGRWLTTPFSIKAQGDRVYSRGVNRIIYHRFTHQPWADDKYLPGMTMGRWGMHFDRTQTWWNFADGWIRYQSRCQAMLQAGEFVADALFYCGSQAPNQGGNTDGVGNRPESLGDGYAWDICAKDAFMRLRVVNGRVVTPGGIGYPLLVMPSSDTIGIDELRKLMELLDAGARVAWNARPNRAPGLVGYPNADAEVVKLVAAAYSKGIMQLSAKDALTRLGISPDFSVSGVALGGRQGATYIHRRNCEADWYFVAVANRKSLSFKASFRLGGRIPEIWNAENGTMEEAAIWQSHGERTEVQLDYPISGSAFVVFRRPAENRRHLTEVAVSAAPVPAATKKTTDRLEIVKAEYGVIGRRTMDIAQKLRDKMMDGRIIVNVSNAFAGRDPVPMSPKAARIDYRLNGVDRVAVVGENQDLELPPGAGSVDQLPAAFLTGGNLVATRSLSAAATYSNGTSTNLCVKVPGPIEVTGGWKVSFPNRFLPNALAKGKNEEVEFGKLVDWKDHPNSGIRYFSGTATYRTSVKLPECAAANRAGLLLDLGIVHEVARVTVNGKRYPSLWKPPFRVDVSDQLREGVKSLDIEVEVANLWANRLIGDDREFADDCEWQGEKKANGVKEIGIKKIPQWVKEGKRSPTGRSTFTTWKHWDKDDTPLPSGMLGPVRLNWLETIEL